MNLITSDLTGKSVDVTSVSSMIVDMVTSLAEEQVDEDDGKANLLGADGPDRSRDNLSAGVSR